MGAQTLALFFRALRMDVRLLHAHFMRVALLVFVLLTMLSAQFVSPVMGAPGLMFFSQITFINLAFASLACPLLFATCITEEKEEQTLGLLRMANLGPLSILMGKLAPRLASALLILVVQFPFTLLAITLGGVTSRQVVAAFCGLLAHTFLIGNIGMFCSVVARRTGTAVGLSLLLVIGHFVIPAIGYGYFSSTTPPPGAATSNDVTVQWLVWLHEHGLRIFDVWYHATASVLLSNVMTTGFGGSVLSLQVVSNFAAGAAIFILAWLLFDRFNRDLDATAIGAARTLSDVFRRKGRRSIRAWSTAAIIGREFRFASGGYSSWFVKLLAYGPAAYGALVLAEGSYRRVSVEDFGAMLMGMMLFVVFPLEAIVLASRVFRGEIKERTWSTLFMLPQSLANISYSKVAGAAIALAPTLFYFVLGSTLNPRGIVDFLRELDEPGVVVATFVTVANVVFLLHLVCWFAILTNSWIGVLLAVVSWFAALFLWQICIMTPLFIGGFSSGIDEHFFYVMYAIVGCVLFVASAVLHWHTGIRLRHAAAV